MQSRAKFTTERENFSYYIPTKYTVYLVCGFTEWFVKFPDSSTWDSDLDFYGYTELVDAKITECYMLDENEQETEVEYKSLNTDVKQEIERQLDQLIIEG